MSSNTLIGAFSAGETAPDNPLRKLNSILKILFFCVILYLINVSFKVTSSSLYALLVLFIFLEIVVLFLRLPYDFLINFYLEIKPFLLTWLQIIFIQYLIFSFTVPTYVEFCGNRKSIDLFFFKTPPIRINFFKLVFIVFLVSVLSLTVIRLFVEMTDFSDLAFGIQKLLFPLELLGINIKNIVLAIKISLFFLKHTYKQIINIEINQICRGRPKEYKTVFGNLYLYCLSFIPLINYFIKKSDEMTNSLIIKHYDMSAEKKKSDYRILTYSYKDLLALLCFILMVVIFNLVNVPTTANI